MKSNTKIFFIIYPGIRYQFLQLNISIIDVFSQQNFDLANLNPIKSNIFNPRFNIYFKKNIKNINLYFVQKNIFILYHRYNFQYFFL